MTQVPAGTPKLILVHGGWAGVSHTGAFVRAAVGDAGIPQGEVIYLTTPRQPLEDASLAQMQRDRDAVYGCPVHEVAALRSADEIGPELVRLIQSGELGRLVATGTVSGVIVAAPAVALDGVMPGFTERDLAVAFADVDLREPFSQDDPGRTFPPTYGWVRHRSAPGWGEAVDLSGTTPVSSSST